MLGMGVGTVFAILAGSELLRNRSSLIENRVLSDTGVSLFMAILSFTISAAYILKKLQARKIELED